MFQETYEPDIDQKGLFKVPNMEERKSINSSYQDASILNDRRHLIFLCHGYSGHYDDLKYLKAAIMENDPTAKVHSCLKDRENSEEKLFALGEIVAKEIK